MKHLLVAAAVIVSAAYSVRISTFDPDTPKLDTTLNEYRAGRAALQRAIDAVGGFQVLSAFKDMSFSFQAVNKARGQSARHDGDYTELPAAGRVVFESTGRILYDFKTGFRGGREVEMLRVFDSNEGWNYRVSENELSEMTTFDLGFLMRSPGLYPVDAMPHSLILGALGNASSIRALDPQPDAETVSVEYSTQTGRPRTLVINTRTGLPTRVEYVISDPLQGDTQAEVLFSQYRSIDGIRIPHRLDFTLRGEDMGHWTLSEVAINTSPDESVFARPDVPLTRYAAPFQPQKVADGVYAIRLYSGLGFTYNTMLVEMDDYVVMVEAPLSDFFYNVVKGLADKVAPGKPIRYAVSTHYHFDHTNGIKAYMASGATVLTVADNARFLKEVAKADHTLLPNPLRGHSGAVSIEVVEKERTLGTGKRQLRLVNVGPNPHVDEILMAYLPTEGIVFISDLVSTFDGGHDSEPTEAMLAFDKKLSELGIEPKTIVPGHGPTIDGKAYKAGLSQRL